MTLNILKTLRFASSLLICGFSTTSLVEKPLNNPSKKPEPIVLLSNATELDRKDLDVSFMTASRTETSSSFKLAFTSSLLDTFYTLKYPNFYVAIDEANSPSYSGKYTDYGEIDDADLESFDSYVYLIKNEDGSAKNSIVHIPCTFTRKGSFKMNVTSIHNDACTDFTNISKIYIPETITVIDSGAFKNVPDTVEILCESESAPLGWASDWCDNMSVVKFGKIDDERQNEFVNLNTSDVKEFGEAQNYIVGYKSNANFPGEEYNLPLVAEYKVTKNDSSVETRYYEIPLTTKNSNFDGVGRFASTSFMVNLDLSTEKGEEIDPTSFVIHNIYKAKKEESLGYTVDFEQKFYAPVRIAYKKMITISDYFDISFLGVSNFLDYSSIRLNVDKGPSDSYEKLMPGVYNQNKYKLDEGSYKIRYSFQNLNQCKLFVKYLGENGVQKEISFSINSPNGSQTINKDKGNVLSFMFKPKDIAPDFKVENIITLDITGLTPQIDLYSSTGTVLNVSKLFTRFGYLSILTEGKEVKSTSVSLITFLFFLFFTLAYAGLAVALFFYKQEKYKNDEFRRMKPKKFIKNAIIGYIGSFIAAFAVFAIIMRSTLFASTMVVHNPMDAFVIAFSLAGLIAIGYGIRTLVVTMKSEKQRRMRIKLKLNEETADDGTK